jgi:hypothetical protein
LVWFEPLAAGHLGLGKTQLLFHLLPRRLHLSQSRWLSVIHQQETLKKIDQRRMEAAERRGGTRRRKRNMKSMIGARSTILTILTTGGNARKTRRGGDTTPTQSKYPIHLDILSFLIVHDRDGAVCYF